jgi:hypothetical protein
MTCGHECGKCGGCCCAGFPPALVVGVCCSGADLQTAEERIGAVPGVLRAEADTEQMCLWVWCDDREVALEDLQAILQELGCLPAPLLP